MAESVILTGMVLSSMPIGDYDKRLVILTKERGKIHAFAKGARRSASPLLACSNPFAFGEFEVYEGRSAYSLSKAAISNYFLELAADYEAACYGFYFLEVADFYTRENNDEVQMLKLLYQSLRALSKKTIELPLIRYIFELKTLVINGISPQFFECMSCGGQEQLTAVSPQLHGALCSACAGSVQAKMTLSSSAFYALQFTGISPIEKLYTFRVTKEVMAEIKKVMDYFFKAASEHHFKSLEVLRQLSHR